MLVLLSLRHHDWPIHNRLPGPDAIQQGQQAWSLKAQQGNADNAICCQSKMHCGQQDMWHVVADAHRLIAIHNRLKQKARCRTIILLDETPVRKDSGELIAEEAFGHRHKVAAAGSKLKCLPLRVFLIEVYLRCTHHHCFEKDPAQIGASSHLKGRAPGSRVGPGRDCAKHNKDGASATSGDRDCCLGDFGRANPEAGEVKPLAPGDGGEEATCRAKSISVPKHSSRLDSGSWTRTGGVSTISVCLWSKFFCGTM